MNSSFHTISRALSFLVEHQEEQPSLAMLANHLELSESHVQRTFQAYAGLSPKQFTKALTRQKAIDRLQKGDSVLDAAIECGLSGPGRLHDLLISTDAITPGEARQKGSDLQLLYGSGESPFGDALIAWSSRGLSFLAFTNHCGERAAIDALKKQWPAAEYHRSEATAKRKITHIFAGSGHEPIDLWLRGTPFQLKVWEALMAIPAGTHCSYGQIAGHIGHRGASRAVGSAVGQNPIAWLVPCHRVITRTGALGGYRWGTNIKQAMIGIEDAGVLNSV